MYIKQDIVYDKGTSTVTYLHHLRWPLPRLSRVPLQLLRPHAMPLQPPGPLQLPGLFLPMPSHLEIYFHEFFHWATWWKACLHDSFSMSYSHWWAHIRSILECCSSTGFKVWLLCLATYCHCFIPNLLGDGCNLWWCFCKSNNLIHKVLNPFSADASFSLTRLTWSESHSADMPLQLHLTASLSSINFSLGSCSFFRKAFTTSSMEVMKWNILRINVSILPYLSNSYFQ